MSKDRLNGTLCEADSKDEEAGEEVWISGCEWLCGSLDILRTLRQERKGQVGWRDLRYFR